MSRIALIVTFLLVTACSGQTTPPPATPAGDSPTETLNSPTTIPPASAPVTSAPAEVSSTEPPPTASTFPNADAYEWRMIASGLQRPVDLQPDGSGRLFLVEKPGRILIMENDQVLSEPFLDITDRVGSSGNEQGLLGLAFHPQYLENGWFFVNYTDINGDTVLSRFQAGSDANRADPDSELKLLGVDQPYPNHNGGALAFGPDGYLYAGLGDGGSAGDPQGNAQNLDSLLGKVLRLDVSSGEPYAIPGDNPFGNEIWAYGLRNPWRLSFDQATGDLYIGDVGQGQWEEIDFLAAGSAGGTNFGWDHREGAHDFEGGGPAEMVDPVAEYSHPEGGCSVTGGYVYRGAMPEWNGIYLYGDYCTGIIWGLIRSNSGWQEQQLFDVDVTITSFGQDDAGEVYLVSDSGSVHRLVSR